MTSRQPPRSRDSTPYGIEAAEPAAVDGGASRSGAVRSSTPPGFGRFTLLLLGRVRRCRSTVSGGRSSSSRTSSRRIHPVSGSSARRVRLRRAAPAPTRSSPSKSNAHVRVAGAQVGVVADRGLDPHRHRPQRVRRERAGLLGHVRVRQAVAGRRVDRPRRHSEDPRDLAGGELALLEELGVVVREPDRRELHVAGDDRDRCMFATPACRCCQCVLHVLELLVASGRARSRGSRTGGGPAR